ncbi:MAG: KH domain-containing protein [Bacilli bacterium]
MRELVELITRGLVDEPDRVRVHEVQGEKGLVYQISVAPSDVGKVIGKGGRIVKSMRTVVSAASLQDNRRVSIEIL